ncbi:MAG: amidohydrolase family protein [Actinobacteria bacterium]|nr:amidohydrolase family protein [Actinomycetota bacterium]
MEGLQRAHELVESYAALVAAELPHGVELFDAHVHLGHDIDGMVGEPDELLAIQSRFGITGSFMFCLDEHDRHPGFRAANDRTLAFARRSEGALIPFVRLDLAESPLEEALRCLELGARGIKLHPRAQGFLFDDVRLAPVFELAGDRGVPVLVHGGRGLPPIADALSALVERYAGVTLIVAHAGIADMAALAGHFGGVAGVFFDSSVWSPLDLLDLYRQVSPEQVVYASDYPYGRQPGSLLLALRTAKLAGLSDEQLRAVLGESARRIAAGKPPLPLSGAVGGDTLTLPLTFARIHQYLSMATPLLWLRQPDAWGALGLALNATHERNGHRDETEQIRELLERGRELWKVLPELEDERERISAARTAIRLVQLADILAVTTPA